MKKYNYLGILFCLVSFVLSGNAQDSYFKLSLDPELNTIYSKDEIKDLERLVYFVDEFVQDRTKEKKIKNAYAQFFKNWHEAIYEGKLTEPILEKEKYAILDTINPQVFESIWEFETDFNSIVYRDSILTDFSGIKYLKLKPRSRFLEYIKVKGKTSEFYNYFYQTMQDVGGISASMNIRYAENMINFDYNTIEDRLFAAIYILNLEVDVTNKLDVYFGN